MKSPLFSFLRAVIHQQLYLVIDLLIEQARVLKRLIGKWSWPTNDERRRLAALAHKLDRRILEAQEPIVTVDTFLRWHRQLIAAASAKRTARSRLDAKIETLMVQLAADSPPWDKDSIRDRLAEVGITVTDRTAANVCFASVDCKPKVLPPRSPNLNAYIERIIGTVRREVGRRIIPLSGEHLRAVLWDHIAYYYHERIHQGLSASAIPVPIYDRNLNTVHAVKYRSRLGKTQNYYCRGPFELFFTGQPVGQATPRLVHPGQRTLVQPKIRAALERGGSLS